ncbi:EpsG family protein [Enterococcus bulliens]
MNTPENVRLNHKNKGLLINITFFISFLLLWILAGARVNTGVDYTTYSLQQIPATLGGDYSVVEPLSTVVFIVGNYIWGYQGIFILIHFLILFFIFKSIYQNSPLLAFSVYLLFISGFYNHSLNLMRQSIAIAIFLYALKFIFTSNFWKYFLCILIAFLFHKTAVLFIPIYFLRQFRLDFKNTIIYVCISIPSLFVANTVLQFITTYFGVYRNYWGEAERAATNNFSGSYTILNIIILILLLTLSKISKKNDSNPIDFIKENIFLICQFISLIIIIFAYFFYLPNFDRILMMFTSVQILSIPYFMNKKINFIFKLIIFVIISIVYSYVFYNIIYLQDISGTFNYHSIINF